MTEWALTITVPGDARPQGSKNTAVSNTGKVSMWESAAGLKAWRERVGWMAVLAARDAGVPRLSAVSPWWAKHVPVELDVTFVRPRPASVSAAVRPYPVTPPDGDKLLRAVCDALTQAHVWHDDAQAVEEHVHDRYAGDADAGNLASGAIIRLRTFPAPASNRLD